MLNKAIVSFTSPANNLQPDTLLTYPTQPVTSALQTLELPFDHTISPSSLSPLARFSFTISKIVYADLKKPGFSMGNSLSTIMLATFKVLLYRYSNQPDIPISVIASKPTGSVNGSGRLMGSELKEVVLLTDISDEPGFLDLVKRIHDIIRENEDSDRMSFTSWIEAAGIAGLDVDLIFQAVLNFAVWKSWHPLVVKFRAQQDP
jgi:hypothetical protein